MICPASSNVKNASLPSSTRNDSDFGGSRCRWGAMYVPRTITFRNRCGLSSMLVWKLWLVRRRGDWRALSMRARKRAASITCRGESGIPPGWLDVACRCNFGAGARAYSKGRRETRGKPSHVRIGLDFKLRENPIPLDYHLS